MKTPREQPPQTARADERFESGAAEYAEYLRTVEGRLRLDIAWENFRAALSEANDPAADDPADAASVANDAASPAANNEAASDVSPGEPRSARVEINGARGFALDLGCGTGALASRLARAGFSVSAADSSGAMIEFARAAARREGLGGGIDFFRLDAARVDDAFGARKFSAVVCHNVLEYVADPAAVVSAVGRVLAPGGLVSLLARNRAGESLRDAVKRHDLDSAERALTTPCVRESLYGGPARLFDADSLRALATAAALETVAVRGVRVVADYLPPALSESEEGYARLLAFELRLGARSDFASVARYVQLIARAPER